VIAVLRNLVNTLVGTIVRSRANFTVGQGNQIKWWALRNTRRGSVEIGKDCIINSRIAFDSPNGRVKVGDRCYLGASFLVCHTGITLGDDVVISWDVTIVDHDSHALDWEHRKTDVTDWAQGLKRWDSVTIRPVHIGNKVWIGFGTSILKGVTVGDGAVIGANSVVTRDVPPFTVVAGNPARIVRKLKEEDISQ
jgi:acetyltransferase-like isoleucine patch superfamily enzyme